VNQTPIKNNSVRP